MTMTGSVAIDVAIGLVFVYLLYSLLATIICEIVANYLGLRARTLREAIIRLFGDDNKKPRMKIRALFEDIWMVFRGLFSKPGGEFVKAFYDQATIKVLARNNFFSSPSYISPASFSKALMEIFREKGEKSDGRQTDLEKIKEVLENQYWINDTARKHILSLLTDANGDLVKFRILLERWYDSTMERAIGWYKQKIQVVLLLIGLFLAISFNVSTLRVVNILSTDDKARQEMVKMATAYLENNKERDTSMAVKDKLDSLLQIKKQLEADIASANSIMGLGWNVPDSLPVDCIKSAGAMPIRLSKDKIRYVHVPAKTDTVLVRQMIVKSDDGVMNFIRKLIGKPLYSYDSDFNQNSKYISLSFWKGIKSNFWGFLLTAMAISLGSPFWFDLLSKLVQIRGSVRQTVQAPATTESSGKQSDLDPLQRKA